MSSDEPRRPLKTLHITNMFHPHSGGIRTFYEALLEGANRRRRPVRLIVPGERTEVEEVGRWGRIYYLAARRSPILDRRYRLLLPWRFAVPGLGRLHRILRQERPDLIEICDKYSLNYLAAMLSLGLAPGLGRRPVAALSFERMDDSVAQQVTAGRIGKLFSRLYMRFLYMPMFDFHISCSRYAADELVEAAAAVRRPRRAREVWVCPLGADAALFHPSRRRSEVRRRLERLVGGAAGSRLLLYAGRLSVEKNLHLLVESFARLVAIGDADWRLIVAGDGPLRREIWAALEAGAPGRFALLGHVADRADLADLCANCDAFVHPNPREPFGIAPLEAMAAGLPLVAPAAGGVLSYASENNAWLAAPDPAAFAAAIRRRFEDPDPAVKIDHARRTAEGLSWERVVDEYFTLYDQLHERFVDRRRPGAAAPPVPAPHGAAALASLVFARSRP